MSRALFVVLFGCLSPFAHAETVVEHDFFLTGEIRGRQVVTDDGEGHLSVIYEYSDNGRGPKLREEMDVGKDGLPDRYSVTGKSSYGADVAESFERKSDRFAWKTLADGEGETPVSGPAFYVPVEYSSEPDAMMIRAALAGGGKIAIVGAGEVSVEEIATHPAAGETWHLYVVRGLSLAPRFMWLTAPPESKTFAFIYPGVAHLMPKGFPPEATAALEKKQVEAENALFAQTAKAHTHHLPEPIVIRNARIFDSESGKVGEPSDIYVNHGRIAAVMEKNSPPVGAKTELDAGGRIVLPGLFDMHVHDGASSGPLHLAAGVTTVRDMGNGNESLQDLARRIEDGSTLGARIVPAGFLEGKSEHSATSDFIVSTLPEAKEAIDWYAARGYPQLKIYNSFPKEHLAATIAYAKQRGLRVSGHVPAFMRAEEVVKMGYDELQHINQMMLNFYVKPTDDTRTLARFYIVAEQAQGLDLDSKPVKDFIQLLVDKHVTLDPTLNAFEDMTYMSGEMHPSYASVAEHLPVMLRRSLRTNSMDVPKDKLATYRKSYARMLEFIGRAHTAGVPIVAGTDSYPGFGLHRELKLLVEAGIPASEVLQIATRNGARYTGTSDRLGRIAPGRLADLVIVDGDPTKDITALDDAVLTMKDGKVFYPDDLYRSVGVTPFVVSLKPRATPVEPTPAAVAAPGK